MAKPKPIPWMLREGRERFWKHVAKAEPDQCWPWQGAVGTIGYGIVKIQNKHYKPHRVAWLFTYESIDDTLTIDHLCRNKLCCNVRHMEQVTQSVNSSRNVRR